MYTIDQIRSELPELASHPEASSLPKMDDEKLQALRLDMQLNGMYHPIYLKDGKILDGRNRYDVLRWLKENGRLEFEPDIRVWDKEDDLSNVVVSMNFIRNNYNSQQRAAYAALYLVNKQKEEALNRMHKKVPTELFPQVRGSANALAALEVGTNEKYVQKACKIKEKNESFLKFVLSKQMTLEDGLQFIRMQDEKREFFFNRMKAGESFEDIKEEYKEIETEVPIATSAPSAVNTRNRNLTEPEDMDIGIIFSMKVSENALNEILRVLHQHGYCDVPFKILLPEDENDFKAKVEPFISELSMIELASFPQDSVTTID